MLARCVEQALGQERELEAAMRRGRPSSSGGSVAALEALLVRADREAKDGGAAVGSVFGLVVGAAGKAAKRKDFSRVGACGTLCRWLVSRGEARLAERVVRGEACVVGLSVRCAGCSHSLQLRCLCYSTCAAGRILALVSSCLS